jgi:hypothetical protein
MSVDEEGLRGGFTSTYLNKYQMAASAKAIAEADMKPFDWVKLVLLKELVGQGLLPEIEVQAHLLKVQRKKEMPHGNSKEAKEGRARSAKGSADKAGPAHVTVPEHTQERERKVLSRAERRDIRNRRRAGTLR